MFLCVPEKGARKLVMSPLTTVKSAANLSAIDLEVNGSRRRWVQVITRSNPPLRAKAMDPRRLQIMPHCIRILI